MNTEANTYRQSIINKGEFTNVSFPMVYQSGKFWYITCQVSNYKGFRYISKKVSAVAAQQMIVDGIEVTQVEWVKM